jgi:hypothetical protein
MPVVLCGSALRWLRRTETKRATYSESFVDTAANQFQPKVSKGYENLQIIRGQWRKTQASTRKARRKRAHEKLGRLGAPVRRRRAVGRGGKHKAHNACSIAVHTLLAQLLELLARSAVACIMHCNFILTTTCELSHLGRDEDPSVHQCITGGSSGMTSVEEQATVWFVCCFCVVRRLAFPGAIHNTSMLWRPASTNTTSAKVDGEYGQPTYNQHNDEGRSKSTAHGELTRSHKATTSWHGFIYGEETECTCMDTGPLLELVPLDHDQAVPRVMAPTGSPLYVLAHCVQVMIKCPPGRGMWTYTGTTFAFCSTKATKDTTDTKHGTPRTRC